MCYSKVLLIVFFSLWLHELYGFEYYAFHRIAVLGKSVVGWWACVLVGLSKIRGCGCVGGWVGGSVGSYVN